MDIRPIRTDHDHAATLAEIDRLWGASPGTSEGDRLDVLVTLVEAYEEERWPITSVDPVEVLEFAMSEMGHSQAELGRLIGRSRASEILRRKRPLTLQMMQVLNREWRIPAEVLIKPYRLQSGEKVHRMRQHRKDGETGRRKDLRARSKNASGGFGGSH